MLIRKTKRFSGIEKYLETGQKKGRDYTRDEADKRVYLGGDLGAFASSTQLTRNTKKWTAHYTHDTISFLDEENINIETMKKINDEILDFYYPIQDKDKLFYYSEAHLPKIQNESDKVTGEIKSRKLHQHLIVSLYDQETGNQIRRPAY